MWAVGFNFEVVRDWQPARFKADPANAGQVLDRALWRLGRRENDYLALEPSVLVK